MIYWKIQKHVNIRKVTWKEHNVGSSTAPPRLSQTERHIRLEHNCPLQPFFSDKFIFKCRNVFTHINHDLLVIVYFSTRHIHDVIQRMRILTTCGVYRFLSTFYLPKLYVSSDNKISEFRGRHVTAVVRWMFQGGSSMKQHDVYKLMVGGLLLGPQILVSYIYF